MSTKYLSRDGKSLVEFKDRGVFDDRAEAEALVDQDPAERFLVPSSEQRGLARGDFSSTPVWHVRVGATSLDRAARRAGLSGPNPATIDALAEALAKGRGVRLASEAGLTANEASAHRLQFTRYLGHTIHATFRPSNCGGFVLVNTTNYRYEDEIHGWMPVGQARKLYRAMVNVGYEAF